MSEPWEGYECFGYSGKKMISIIIEALEESGIENHPPAEKLWGEWSSMIFFLFDWAMVTLGRWEKSMFVDSQSSIASMNSLAIGKDNKNE